MSKKKNSDKKTEDMVGSMSSMIDMMDKYLAMKTKNHKKAKDLMYKSAEQELNLIGKMRELFEKNPDSK